MTRHQLVEQIFSKRSYLCVGLDTDPARMPAHLQNKRHGMLDFNRRIIDATADVCVSYKINTAFYEALGAKGWEILEKTIQHIPVSHFKIADAKRGDIGNTASQYAKAFFETLSCDAVTVAPYMGEDSVRPFLEHENKWAIVLGLTSNPGAIDFELVQMEITTDLLEEGIHISRHEKRTLYELVLEKASKWGNPDNLMFVVGATREEQFENVRKLAPNSFFLVPGVGAQGGSLSAISKKTMISDVGLLVNVSRAICYASTGKDFAEAARKSATAYQQEMSTYLPA
ncbi:MAG TPA: orotidine-5'-phosphate decarboxylase [Chitinophagaceae bacterium]|jgi:orotidine-5'-phosphate decarboxylase